MKVVPAIRNPGILTASSFLSMFLLGVGTTIIGAASRNIGLTPYQIGLLIAAQNVGFFLSVAPSGALGDRASKPRLMGAASFILAGSFFCFYLEEGFLLNLLIMAGIGIGIGGYEGVADAMLLDIHRRRESLFISINHFFVTFGSLAITLYVIFLQLNWRKSLVQAAAAAAVLGALFLFSRVPARPGRMEKLGARVGFLKAQKPLIVYLVVAVCAVGLESSMGGMLTTFLMDFRGFDQVTSKLGLVLFLCGVACGRMVLGFFARSNRIVAFLTVLFAGFSLLAALLFFVALENGLTYGVLFLSGLTLSALFPLVISLAGLRYQEASGTVMGLIKLGVPVGGIAIPFLLSLLSRFVSFRLALLLLPAVSAAGTAILLAARDIRPAGRAAGGDPSRL